MTTKRKKCFSLIAIIRLATKRKCCNLIELTQAAAVTAATAAAQAKRERIQEQILSSIINRSGLEANRRLVTSQKPTLLCPRFRPALHRRRRPSIRNSLACRERCRRHFCRRDCLLLDSSHVLHGVCFASFPLCFVLFAFVSCSQPPLL